MRALVLHGDHELYHCSGILPFCWFKNFGEHYKAQGRDDGLIYIGAFKTKEAAIDWAQKKGIIPAQDPQGDL